MPVIKIAAALATTLALSAPVMAETYFEIEGKDCVLADFADAYSNSSESYFAHWTGSCISGKAEGIGVATIYRELDRSIDAEIHGMAVKGRFVGTIFYHGIEKDNKETRGAIELSSLGEWEGRWAHHIFSPAEYIVIRESGSPDDKAYAVREIPESGDKFDEWQEFISKESFYNSTTGKESLISSDCDELREIYEQEVDNAKPERMNTGVRAADCYAMTGDFTQSQEIISQLSAASAQTSELDLAKIAFSQYFLYAKSGEDSKAKSYLDTGWRHFEDAERQPVECTLVGEVAAACKSVSPITPPSWVQDFYGYSTDLTDVTNSTILNYLFNDRQSPSPLQDLVNLAVGGNTDAMMMLAQMERESVRLDNLEFGAQPDDVSYIDYVSSFNHPNTEWVKFWERSAFRRGHFSNIIAELEEPYYFGSHIEDVQLPISFSAARDDYVIKQGRGGLALKHHMEMADRPDFDTEERLATGGNFVAQDSYLRTLRYKLASNPDLSVEKEIKWYYENTDFLLAHEMAAQCQLGIYDLEGEWCRGFKFDMNLAMGAVKSYSKILAAQDDAWFPNDGYGKDVDRVGKRLSLELFDGLVSVEKFDLAFDWALFVNAEFGRVGGNFDMSDPGEEYYGRSVIPYMVILALKDPSFFGNSEVDFLRSFERAVMLDASFALDGLANSKFQSLSHAADNYCWLYPNSESNIADFDASEMSNFRASEMRNNSSLFQEYMPLTFNKRRGKFYDRFEPAELKFQECKRRLSPFVEGFFSEVDRKREADLLASVDGDAGAGLIGALQGLVEILYSENNRRKTLMFERIRSGEIETKGTFEARWYRAFALEWASYYDELEAAQDARDKMWQEKSCGNLFSEDEAESSKAWECEEGFSDAIDEVADKYCSIHSNDAFECEFKSKYAIDEVSRLLADGSIDAMVYGERIKLDRQAFGFWMYRMPSLDEMIVMDFHPDGDLPHPGVAETKRFFGMSE